MGDYNPRGAVFVCDCSQVFIPDEGMDEFPGRCQECGAEYECIVGEIWMKELLGIWKQTENA